MPIKVLNIRITEYLLAVMKSIEQIETERMIGRRFSTSDFDDLYRMLTDPEVTKTLGGIKTRQETEQALQRTIAHWDEHGFGMWMFYDKATGRFAGRGGFRKLELEGKAETEIAYALMSEFWGKGYATEMALVSKKVAFETLDLPDLVCFTMTTNNASKNVMQKIGFVYERTGEHANLPHVFYRLKNTHKL